MTTKAPTLAKLIHEHRLKRGLNKAELARLVGVTDVCVSYWERGTIKQVGHERLSKIASIIGLSPYRMLDIDEEEMFMLSSEEMAQRKAVFKKLEDSQKGKSGVQLTKEEVALLVEKTSLRDSFAR